MELVKLSGKSVNIEGLSFNEKEFVSFFEKQSPWKSITPEKRKVALKSDYKIFKSKIKKPSLDKE